MKWVSGAVMPWTPQAAQSPSGFEDAATEVAEVIEVFAPGNASMSKLVAAEHAVVGVIAFEVAVVAPVAAWEPPAHTPTASITAAERVAIVDRRRERFGVFAAKVRNSSPCQRCFRRRTSPRPGATGLGGRTVGYAVAGAAAGSMSEALSSAEPRSSVTVTTAQTSAASPATVKPRP